MKWALPVFVTTYAVTSSSLLVLNKLFVDETRAPAFLLLCQVTFSTVYVLFMVCLGKTTLNTSDMRRTLSRFVVIVCSFVGGIYATLRRSLKDILKHFPSAARPHTHVLPTRPLGIT